MDSSSTGPRSRPEKRLAAGFAILAALLLWPGPLRAHDADTSLTRLRLSDAELRVEITLDLLTAARLAPLITRATSGPRDAPEITQSSFREHHATLRRWLAHRVRLAVDQEETGLGYPLEAEWLAESPARSADTWPQDLVVFRWELPLKTRPGEIALLYETWPEIGVSHRNLTVLEQDWQDPIEVPFGPDDAEYLWFPGETPSFVGQALRFGKLGVEHIFIGLDHILFLVGLMVVARIRELIGIVTAFTLGHSLTLALATTGVVALPSRWVEVAIAATILWVAAGNILREHPRHRPLLTFFFGLVHGFGFAEVLAGIGLPASGLFRSLLGFNLGVEVGQLAIVVVLWPATAWVARRAHARRWQQAISAAVGLAGLGWLIDRLAGTAFMPI